MIGRADEAAAVARFAQQLPSGPVGLLIEGEAGIGKTTVVIEAIRETRQRGYRVLVARPAEAETDLSFAALTDLVGDIFDTVREALPPPQRQALDVVLLRREADAPADPRTTASALLSVVELLSRHDPVAIIVDDAQWLDRPSRRALEFVARRLPPRVGLVVASRPGAGSAGPLDIARALAPARLERLVVGPMSLAALHHLIESRVQVKLPRPMLVRVAEASGGNPFYALELARALARGHAPLAPGDALPVPGTLQDLLRDRLALLSAPARHVASAAAALSRPTVEVLAAAIGADLDVDAAILEAEEAGVLTSDRDRLRFTHPLLASALYGTMGAGRRRALHRRIAAVMGDPEEQARHLARAEVTPDDGVARTIEEGAALAARRGAPESAAELYAAACRLTPAGRAEDLARRRLGGASALSLAGDHGGARALATQALETGDPSLRARALLLLGFLASYTESIQARLDFHERALAEAGDDPGLRVEILLALFYEVTSNPERAARRADEAAELLRRQGDAAGLARALIYTFIAGAVLGRGSQPRLLDEALSLEAAAGDAVSIYPLHWYHWIDDLAAARARFRLLDQRYREHGDVVVATELVEFVAMAEFRAGNWAVAEEALDGACETLGQFELRGPFVASFTDRAVIDAHRGRIDRARRTLDDILAVDRLDRFWRMMCRSAQGAVEFCTGNHEAADRAWAAMRADAEVVGWLDFLDDRSEPDHVEALVMLGRLAEARQVLEHLEWRGRTLPRAWIDAGLPRARALLRAAEGELAEGLALLEEAPEIRTLPFEAARLLLVRGQLERRANRKLAARDSLTAALRAFEGLGSPPWAERARAEIARLGLRRRGPHDLTEGERRIAELAATGLTNRQVAEAAFVSPKTVEANLARVYQKLGIRSRAELGARMGSGSVDVEGQA